MADEAYADGRVATHAIDRLRELAKNPDQRFRTREEMNLDNTEGSSRGPLQERASYWFYKQMGLNFSKEGKYKN